MVEENIATHRRVIDEAKAAGVDLLIFPELGLTGYLLQDLNAEVSMSADDPRLAGLGAAAGDMSVVVGFVEESEDHQLYIAAALFEGGELRHVYRKAYLPNYGLFDERRFFAPGTQIGAVDSRLGLICWRSMAPRC
jgi:NAD+ synthase (glutamine-hydrolysing)